MKHLILVLAILTLGCGTDTEVVDKPSPVGDDPASDTREFVVHEIDPATKGDRGDPDPPRIIKSNIYPSHERVSFNSDRLNKQGIFFDFNEDLQEFAIDLSLDGESLGWLTTAIRSGNDLGFSILISPPVDGPFLERRKQYLIDLLAADKAGNVLELEILFWTIP